MIAIQTKYLPATRTRPSRIVATTCHGARLVAPFDQRLSALDAHFAVARALIKRDFSAAPDASTMTYGSTAGGYFFAWLQSEVTA
jgi:hypothetical protein